MSLRDVYELVEERYKLAQSAPPGPRRDAAIEELEEVMEILREVAFVTDEDLGEEEE